MTPAFKILANSQDITNKISDRLVSLSLVDESGIDADTLDIVLDDRDNAIAMPPKGAELSVAIGFKEVGTVDRGLFTVDEISVSGPPDLMTITARAADMRQSLKERKTRSFDNVTLGELVQSVAAEHGLSPGVSDNLSGITLVHIDQTNESDMHLLTRLAKDYDAMATTKNGYLLLVNQGDAKSITGQSLPTIDIKRGDTSRHSFTFPDREVYGSVVARWHDKEAAVTHRVTEGQDKPVYTLPRTYQSAEVAKKMAASKLRSLKRGTGQGQIELSAATKDGRFLQLMADGRVSFSGFRPETSGEWSIKRVEYSLSGTLTVTIDVEIPNK